MRSHLNGIRWSQILDEDVFQFLAEVSSDLNTRMEIIIWSLIVNASAMMGSDRVVSLSTSNKMTPNVYVVIVAERGFGKTPAYKMVCVGNIESLETSVQKNSSLMILPKLDCTL